MRIGLPTILFTMIRWVFVVSLQSNNGFKAGARSWVYYNIVYILFLLFFNQYGTHGLMVAGMLASAIQLYSMIPTLKSMGYRHKRRLDFKDIYLKEASIMLMPIIIGLSVNRVNILIDKAIASILPVGSISWLNYADDII